MEDTLIRNYNDYYSSGCPFCREPVGEGEGIIAGFVRTCQGELSKEARVTHRECFRKYRNTRPTRVNAHIKTGEGSATTHTYETTTWLGGISLRDFVQERGCDPTGIPRPTFRQRRIIYRQKKAAEKAQREIDKTQRESEVAALAERAQAAMNKVENLVTGTAKVNACDKALDLLRQADAYPECRKVITNYLLLVDRTTRAKKVIPIIHHIDRAYRHKYKGKQRLELKALQDALFEIKTHGVTDKDFEIAQLYPAGTEEIVQIENIEARCHELGWDPK